MKVMVLANFSMGLWKFRKELLEKLIKDGHKVYISLPNGEYIPHLKQLGCNYVETKVDRRGTNPITDFSLLLSYINIIKRIKPDIVLTYTIKPNVYGGLACRATKTPYLSNITGLGTAIENKGLIQKIALVFYRMGLKKAKCIFFQNESNKQFFINKNIVSSPIKVIPGSGVNLKEHNFEEYPNETKTISLLYVGRIMKAKGMDELLEAAEIIKHKHPFVEFNLVGYCEELYSDRLNQLADNGVINYHEKKDNVHSYIKNAHAVILPSYHEGMSNALLEAASTGRPVLASEIAGCIEIFDEEVTGMGFAAGNTNSIVHAITKFIDTPYDQKVKMGLAGRKKMEKSYDRNIVIDDYIEQIDKCIQSE